MGSDARVVEPTFQAVTPSGIEVRFFEEDKEAKVKRHYEARCECGSGNTAPCNGPCNNADWQELVSVTTVNKVLDKEHLRPWAQRIGARGTVELFNMGVLTPVTSPSTGQPVLGAFIPKRGYIVVNEEEVVSLLKQYHLSISDKKKEGGKKGSAAHRALELWAETGNLPDPATYPTTEQPYVSALVDFLEDSGAEAVRSEVLVASLEHGYAGRFDLDINLPNAVELLTHHTPSGQSRFEERLWFDSGLYRVDLKTAKDAFDENGEQLEAYEQGAIESGYPATLQRCVIHCGADGKYKFVPVGSGEPRSKKFNWSTFEDFEATLRKWKLTEARKERKKHG